MALRISLHTVGAAALTPLMAYAPLLGAAYLAIWLALAKRQRNPGSVKAALTVVVAVVMLSLVNARAPLEVLLPVALVTALFIVSLKVDAAATIEVGISVGIGSAIAAVTLAVWALLESVMTGFSQVAPASHHPNVSAAMGLSLSAGSLLALRGNPPARLAGAIGAGSGVLVLFLTGSRGGAFGVVVGAAVLGALALGRLIARAYGPCRGSVFAGVTTVAILVVCQLVLLTPSAWPHVVSPLPGALTSLNRGAPDTAILARFSRLAMPLETSGGRLAAWKLSLEIASHRPFVGYGFAAANAVFSRGAAEELSKSVTHPHHGGLATLLEGGTLLLLSIGVYIARQITRLYRSWFRGDTVAGAIAATVIGLIGMEMLDSTLRLATVGGPTLMVLLLGIQTEDNAQSHHGTRGTDTGWDPSRETISTRPSTTSSQ